MCGINGISRQNIDLIQHMNKITERRGPDGSDYWADANVTLGHNLLSIMSELPVKQPYHTDNGVLVFNGAIFNFKELGPGNSDTEVLANGLEQEGISFLKKCRGMWALAWYKNGKLTLARDYFGIKPLYYTYLEDNNIQFSSSIMALNSNRKLNLFAFGIYRHFGYVPGYLTLINNCYKVTPGEIIEFDIHSKEVKKDNLWNYHDFTPNQHFDLEEWNQKLEKAVKESYYGFRQRGIFLSGGLDSTSITHYLQEKNTFSSKYTDTQQEYNDDANVASMFAKDRNLNHTEILISPEILFSSIDNAIEALELPLYNKSTPTYWYVNSKLKEKGTVVTYSGDGGDEMYCGYVTHDRYFNHEDPFRDHFRAIAWPSKKRLHVLNPMHDINEDDYVNYMKSWFPTTPWSTDHLNNCLFIEMLTRVSEDFLTRNDKFGSYFGMEGRFPLLNQEWYMYNMRIPSHIKMKNGGEGKFIAREGLKKVLPGYIINKSKTGWSIPDNEWRKHQTSFRQKMLEVINTPLNNDIDTIVDWSSATNIKLFYSAVYFKKWVKKFNITL